jgi:hypothetical protein
VLLKFPIYTMMVFDEWQSGVPMACIINSRYKQHDEHNDMLHHINHNMIVQIFEMLFILHISFHKYYTMICSL